MKTNRPSRPPAALLGVALAALASGPAARADTLSWWGLSPNSVNWSDPLNWTNTAQLNATPANGDNLVFTALNPSDNTNNLSGFSGGWLQFANGTFTLDGNALTLSGGITNSVGDNVFNLPLTLSGAQTFEVDASSLTFNGAITNNGDLTVAGVGNVTWANVAATAVPAQGLRGSGNLIVNGPGSVTINGGFIYPATSVNFAGNTIVNSGGVLNMNAGDFDGNSQVGQSLTINPGGTVHTGAPHIAGSNGRPLSIYGGTLDMESEAYFTTIILSNASLTTGASKDLRGSGSFTNLASSATTTFGVALNLTSSRTVGVALGSVDPDIDFTGNGNAAFQGSGNLTKAGPGKMRISGPANHTGTTTISGGTLALVSTMANTPLITVASNAVFDISGIGFSLNTNQVLGGVGTVLGTLGDYNYGVTGAVLAPGGNNAAGTLTMDGLSLSGNGLALNFDLANNTAAGGGTNDLLIVTNFTASAGLTNTVNISFLNGTPAIGSAYTLIKYYNGFAGDPSQFLTAAASRYLYTFTNDTSAGAIKLIVTGTPGNLVWKGDGVSNTWDVATTTNWLNGAAKDVFLQGDNATFNDVGSNTPPVNIAAAVLATTVTVNSTKDYTFTGSGKISNGAKLLKSNSGNLTILTANDNTGGGSLSGSGTVTVGNGSTTVANLGTGPLTNNTKVTFFENANVTYAGNMSGSGNLVSFMPGATLTVTGTNTYTGGTTVRNGTFQIGNDTAGASMVGSITNYATLNLYRSDAFTNQNPITSAGNTLEYGNGDINVRGVGGMTVDGTASINTLPQGNLSVGQSAAGLLTVNPGGQITLGANLLLGNPNTAAGYGNLVQNGGTITVGNQVRIGHWASEVSTYMMNGGTLIVPNAQLGVGWDGIGLMTLANGTVNCRSLTVDDGSGFTAAISGTNSVFTMTGGQLNIGTGGIGGNTQTNTDVNNIRLSGGTIAASAPAGFSSSMAMTLTNGSPTFDSSNSVVTLSGVLSGNGGLVKQGTGCLNLNGANTFAGAVTVAKGTLQGAGTVAAPVTVQSGAMLSAGGVLGTGTLTLSNVTMNSGAGMVFDLNSTAATGDQLVVKGTLALDSVGTPATLNFLGGVPYTGAPYTLLTNWMPRTGHLVMNPSGTTRYAATVDETNPNRIQVSFSGANAALVWKGNLNSLWDVNADANWLNGGVADKYFQSDTVLFDSTGAGTPNVVLASNLSPASVTVNAAGNYSFSGADLVGVGSLTKNGAGTLTIADNVNLTGTITVGGGMLQIGNGGTSGYIAGNINDYSSVVFNRADTVTYGVNPVTAGTSTINGSGSLTQAGVGKLVIVSTLNHNGGTTINSGSTLQLGNGNAVDVGSLGNSPAVNNGTVIFYRASGVAVATPYSGNGAFLFQGTGDSGQSAYSLNATNTFTGPVTLSSARIQSGAGAQSFGNPSSITVAPASQVYATAQPYSSVYNIPLTLAGTGWQDGLGALRVENGATWAGPITLAANTRIGVNNASTNTLTGTISGNYELETYGGNAAASLVLAPTAANSFNALRVSIGTAGATTVAGNANAIPNNIPLTMNGGTLKLNGFSKTFSSFLNLNGSSSIQNGSAASPATVTLTPVLGSSSYSGTFADGGSQPLNVMLTQAPGQWTMALATASPNWTGNLTNNGGTITCNLQNTGFGSQSVANRFIVGNNGAVFTATINNALNAYAGNLVLNNSTFNFNRFCGFASGGSIYLANSTLGGSDSSDAGYFQLNLPATVTVRGTAPSYISGGGTSPGYNPQAAGTTFDVADATGNANPDLIVTAPLANHVGGATLIKTGAGTMELDGANTYTGPTTISQGTLALGASASLASANLSVAAGATLDVSAVSGGLSMLAGGVLSGSGTVKGSLTDGSSTVIQPGGANSAGTLTVTSGLTLNGAGGLVVDLSSSTGGGNDKIVVGGTLTISSSTPTPVTFNFLNGAPALNTPYTLIQCGSISGTVATAFTNSPSRYVATYSQSGNNVVVTFSGAASSLVWTGTDPLTPATWDVATSTNWSNGSGADMFYQFDSVRFDDTSAQTTVTLNSTVTPTAITADSTNNYTITGSGSIAGRATLTKNNTNTLSLGTVNTFNGTINVNAGKLALGANDALPPGVLVNVASNAVFDFTDYNGNTTTRGYSFVIAGSGPDGLGAMVDSVDGGGIYSYACVSNLTLTANSVIGGIERWDIGSDPNSKLDGQGHTLTIVGTGHGAIDIRSQIITNVAGIIVSNPLTWYENYNQTNAWTANTTNYIAPGSVLGNYGARIINVPIVLNGAAIKNQGGGSPAVWTGGILVSNTSLFNNSAGQNFYGVISGPGGVNIGGAGTAGVNPGTLTFSNANSYSGGTILSNAPVTATNSAPVSGYAALVVANANALGSGPVLLDLSLMTTNAMTNVARALEFDVSGGGTVPNAIQLPTAGVTNVSIQGHDSTSVFTLSGQISGGYSGLTNWFDFPAGAPGIIRLANAGNNFQASTIYVPRGELAITAGGCLGNSANVVKLDHGLSSVAGVGGLRFDAPSVTVAQNILANSGTAFDLLGDNNGDGVTDTANTATLTGVLGGAGTMYVRGANGTLILGGNNTCSGGFELQQPVTLQVAASANLGTAYVAIKAGSTFRYTGTGSETMTRTLWDNDGSLGGGTIDIPSATASLTWNPGGGSINQNLTKTGAGALTLGTLGISGGVLSVNGGTMTVNSVISGAATTVQVNHGTLTLAGANTYNGGTLVNGGTLFVNGSLPAANNVTVGLGGTLGGNGTLNCPVSVAAGASLSPGVNGIGRLTVSSTLNLAGTTTMEIDGTAGTNDAVVGLSAVTYGGTLNVNNLGGTPTNGMKFTLFGAVDRVGSFAAVNLPNISPLTWNNLLSVDGSIVAVQSGPSLTPAYITNGVSGTKLVLTWPTDHTGYRLLVQTNHLSGISANPNDWGTVSGSTTTNQMWLNIDTAKPTEFYRLVYP